MNKQPFDPWIIETQEEAMLESERLVSDRYGWPFQQWLAACRVNARKQEILEGEASLRLFEAVNYCLKHNLSAPSWLQVKFESSLFLLQTAQARTLDKAFGKPFPSGKHASSIVKNEGLRHAIFFYVCEEMKKGTSVNKNFWEDVSIQFTGKDSRHKDMEKLYKECCEEFNRNPIQERLEKKRRERKTPDRVK